MSDLSSDSPGAVRDPYRGVVLVLLALALLGASGTFAGAVIMTNRVLLDVATTLAIAGGVLAGVAVTQRARATLAASAGDRLHDPRDSLEADPATSMAAAAVPAADEGAVAASPPVPGALIGDSGPARSRPLGMPVIPIWITNGIGDIREASAVRTGTAIGGFAAILFLLLSTSVRPISPDAATAAIAATLCLIAAGVAATAVRYLAGIEDARFPEARGLSRGARIVAWVFVLGAIAVGLACADQSAALRVVDAIILIVDGAICYGLVTVTSTEAEATGSYPLDLGVLAVLGSRTNVLVSILDAGERQIGIDLRSTWALTVVRRSLEPLVIGLGLIAWLSTALTVVATDEHGLVERLGVPVGGEPMTPGLHLHWPWPIDRVFRIPVRRVQALTVGHEGEEAGGPEDVLWARQHAANEYTLLLGNGRDLLTVDAAVQFRIADARAWRYHCQNPADALRAIAYRAVMRSTVNHTLAEVLSENLVAMTAGMHKMVQQDADALGLGVEVLSFTVGGMHPPVAVATDYEAVVSAELGKVTAVVDAQAYRNRTVPSASSAALAGANGARAAGADARGRAAGEAWAFLTLLSQFRIAPEEYFYRRRLETLEQNLAGHRFTVVDARFQRDGGELWITP